MTDPNLIKALEEISRAISNHSLYLALGVLAITLVLIGTAIKIK